VISLAIPKLLLQLSYVSDELIDLAFRKLVFELRHFRAAAIINGIENAFIANVVLPASVGDVSGVRLSALSGSRPAITAMTTRAMTRK
jgi:hypothetical protein